MNIETDLRPFGTAAKCSSIEEITDLIKSSPSNPILRRQSAAFGLLLSALHAQGQTQYFDDTRNVLDQLSRAKAEIDIAAWHDLSIVDVTTAILLGAQRYFEEMTIPCTEWPTPKEIVAVVAKEAQNRASA